MWSAVRLSSGKILVGSDVDGAIWAFDGKKASKVTSMVAPVSASMSQSRRQNFAGRKTFGSSSFAPASWILVAESAPALSAPRSAASASSRAPSGAH